MEVEEEKVDETKVEIVASMQTEPVEKSKTED